MVPVSFTEKTIFPVGLPWHLVQKPAGHCCVMKTLLASTGSSDRQVSRSGGQWALQGVRTL